MAKKIPWQTHRRWPDSEKGPYEVTIEWGEVGGRAEPLTFAVRTLDDEQPVTATLFRQLSPGRVVDEERRRIAERYTKWQETHPGERPGSHHQEAGVETWTLDTWLARDAEPFAEPSRRGPSIEPDVYDLVARIYREAYAAGRPPTLAVAAHFGISKQAAAKRVARARDKKKLPATRQGRSGVVNQEEEK